VASCSCAALQEGRLRGAGLDVFYEEPLPAHSPLWSMDNVFMSPHCADRTRVFQFETMDLFMDNLERYLDQQPLLNVCDKRAGY
jgi:phosphoglycerate dehydrogenase-like enzyme